MSPDGLYPDFHGAQIFLVFESKMQLIKPWLNIDRIDMKGAIRFYFVGNGAVIETGEIYNPFFVVRKTIEPSGHESCLISAIIMLIRILDWFLGAGEDKDESSPE